MRFLKALSTAASPRKVAFARQLEARRRECARNALAWATIEGSGQGRLQALGLKTASLSFSPEGTIANVLAAYRLPHIGGYYQVDSPADPNRYQVESGRTAEQRRLASVIAAIDYELSGNRSSSNPLPTFATLAAYIRYKVAAEHPRNPYLSEEFGFTDEFLRDAINQSKYVFSDG